jgi:16S rRNA (adenine1518-N6/adenine1519-N6)-dimethyltransferase
MTGDGTGGSGRNCESVATGSRDPDALLDRAGVHGDPRRDQHFLVDDRVLDRLPSHLPDSVLDGGAHVLEIGAGTGALTDRLLAAADRVTAIERDARLAAFLREEFADAVNAGRLRVVAADALDTDLPAFDACVSNLPYGVSSELLFRLLPRERPLVVTVQRAFADRLVAAPGTDAYGRLSVSAGHYAASEVVEPVPPEAFRPAPAVESAVVRTAPRDPNYAVPADAFFLRFVKALFTQRRKTVRNAIRNTAHVSGLADPDALIEAADDDRLDRRPERLEPPAFAELAALADEVSAR